MMVVEEPNAPQSQLDQSKRLGDIASGCYICEDSCKVILCVIPVFREDGDWNQCWNDDT